MRKNVMVSNELRHQMMVPSNPEVGVWKENTPKRYLRHVKPTSDMLIDKYVRQQHQRHTNMYHASFRGEACQVTDRHLQALGTDMHGDSEELMASPEGFTMRGQG
jgi:hypothetical protein